MCVYGFLLFKLITPQSQYELNLPGPFPKGGRGSGYGFVAMLEGREMEEG